MLTCHSYSQPLIYLKSEKLAPIAQTTAKKGLIWHNYGNVIMGKTTTGVLT